MLIIFDLDDTLIDTFGCNLPVKMRIALQEMIKAGLQVNSFDEAYSVYVKLNGELPNGKEALRSFLSKYPDGEKYFEIGRAAYYGGPILDFPVHALEGVHETLKLLSKKHEFALVSHGEKDEQYAKMKKANLDTSLFSPILIVSKYDKTEFYEQIVKEHNVAASQVLVVGDKYDSDLLPAKNLGMKTVHMVWGRSKIVHNCNGADFCITKFEELKKIVAELDAQ